MWARGELNPHPVARTGIRRNVYSRRGLEDASARSSVAQEVATLPAMSTTRRSFDKLPLARPTRWRRLISSAACFVVVLTLTLSACSRAGSPCEDFSALNEAVRQVSSSTPSGGAEAFSFDVSALRDAVDTVSAQPNSDLERALSAIDQATGNLEDIAGQVDGGASLADLGDSITGAQAELSTAATLLTETPEARGCGIGG